MKTILEKNTAAFIEEVESKGGKPLYKLTPEQAREVLEKVQSGSVDKPDAQIEEKRIPAQTTGQTKKGISLLIYRPKNSTEALPVIMYFHGAGWVMGSPSTHDRLVRELCVKTHAAVVFVDYSRSPEAHYPTAIEEAYAAAKYVYEHGKEWHLDTTHFAVCGDSVGGNMAIAVTMLAKQRHGPKIDCQALFYPVTCAELNTPSYTQFADGPWLTKPAMEWFWHAYEPDASARKKPLLSPLLASIEELKGLPPALVITAENDVLRDEGEHYASKLMQAGVDVTATRFLGTIHDFAMLNALAHTPAALGALALSTSFLHERLSRSRMARKAA